MTEYLINLSPNQRGYPKSLFSPKKVISNDKEDNPIKKSKTYAYDDSKINSSEEKLSPELIDYLKGIAPESDEDEDQGKYVITKMIYCLFTYDFIIGTKKSYPNHTQSRRSNFQEMETSSDEDIDKTHQKKRRNKDNNKQYMSILTRLTSANPSFVWKISETGPLKSYYLTIFKLSIKWALITDPYNPRARRTGGNILIFF